MDGFDIAQINLLDYLVIRSKNSTCFYSEYYDTVRMNDTLNAYCLGLTGALFDCGLWIPNDILDRFTNSIDTRLNIHEELNMMKIAHINHERWCSRDDVVCFYGHHEVITDYLSPLLSVHCECRPCSLDKTEFEKL